MPSTKSPAAATNDVRGIQRPRLCWFPPSATSAGLEAIELARLAGLNLDPWEEFVLANALGEREDGKWAAFEVGLVVPRQNGKGTILEARELAGAFLLGERLIIHSAHEQATSSEHFRRLLNLIEGVPEFERRVLKAPRGKGAEAIELRGGQRILFKTRTGGGGRGLTGDLVALDEAMILPVATTAALVPVMAGRSIEGNPQLWYSGSAVDQQKQEHGIVLARLRDRGLKHTLRVAYFEWSAEGDNPDTVPDKVLTDPTVWAQANPGLGIRISAEHIANECAGALAPREFAVERLGIGDWPGVDGPAAVLSLEKWMGLEDPMSSPVDPVCFAVDVTPDRGHSAIGIAGLRADGKRHVEIVEHRRGTGWVADRLHRLVQAHKPLAVVLDAAGPAASLLPALADLEIEVTVVNAKEHAQACGMLFDAYDQDMLRHLGTPELTAAVKGGVTRPLGEAWAWSRKSSTVDISPLVAVTLALWGSATVNTTDVWMSF
jgi:hypothetical protein